MTLTFISFRKDDPDCDNQATTTSSKIPQQSSQEVVVESMFKLMFKEAVDPRLLELYADLGEKLSYSIEKCRNPNLTHMDEFIDIFMQKNGVDPNVQKLFGSKQSSVHIERVKEGENNVHEHSHLPEIYTILGLFEEKWWVIVKAGINMTNKRRGDFVKDDSKQKYVVIQRLTGAWDDVEEAMRTELFKFLNTLATDSTLEISDEFRSYCAMIVNGGYSCGLLRAITARAIESYFSTRFQIQSHRKYNPHEFIANTSDKFYKKRTEQMDETIDSIVKPIRCVCQTGNLHFQGIKLTYPVAEEHLDEKRRGKYISAQVMLGMFMISGIPGYESMHEDMLEGVEDPKSVYDTNFSDGQRDRAIAKFESCLKTTENKPASLVVAAFNPKATRHRSEKNLLDIATKSGWNIITEVKFAGDEGNRQKCPRIVLCSKNKSILIFMNSPGTCCDPRSEMFSSGYQRDALFALHVVHKVLAHFEWDGKKSLESRETAFLAANFRERMDIVNVGRYNVAFNLKAMFAKDMYSINMYDGQYGLLLRKTRYITQPSTEMIIKKQFEYRNLHIKLIRDRDLNKVVKSGLEKYATKLKRKSRNSKEYKQALLFLVELLIGQHFAKQITQPAELEYRTGIVDTMLKHQYKAFLNEPHQIIATGFWSSEEVLQYCQGFLQIHGEQLENKLKKPKHTKISEYISTR